MRMRYPLGFAAHDLSRIATQSGIPADDPWFFNGGGTPPANAVSSELIDTPCRIYCRLRHGMLYRTGQ